MHTGGEAEGFYRSLGIIGCSTSPDLDCGRSVALLYEEHSSCGFLCNS